MHGLFQFEPQDTELLLSLCPCDPSGESGTPCNQNICAFPLTFLSYFSASLSIHFVSKPQPPLPVVWLRCCLLAMPLALRSVTLPVLCACVRIWDSRQRDGEWLRCDCVWDCIKITILNYVCLASLFKYALLFSLLAAFTIMVYYLIMEEIVITLLVIQIGCHCCTWDHTRWFFVMLNRFYCFSAPPPGFKSHFSGPVGFSDNAIWIFNVRFFYFINVVKS